MLPADLCEKHQLLWTTDMDPRKKEYQDVIFDIAAQGNAHLARALAMMKDHKNKAELMSILRPQIVRAGMYYELLEKCSFYPDDPSLEAGPFDNVRFQARLMKSRLFN